MVLSRLSRQFGVIFKSRVLGPPSTCPTETVLESNEHHMFQSHLLFDSDEYVLKEEAEKK